MPLSKPLTCELVESDLDLKRGIPILLIHIQVTLLDKGDLLVGCLGAQYVAYEILEHWLDSHKEQPYPG